MTGTASRPQAAPAAGTGAPGVGTAAPGAGAAALRRRLAWLSLAVDLVLAVAAYEQALVVFNLYHGRGLRLTTAEFDWALPVMLVAVLVTFVAYGLYHLEVYVSRPLHLLTLFRASVVALVVTGFLAFTLKAPLVAESRLLVFSSFATFFFADALLRIGLLDRLYQADVRRRRGGTLVLGASLEGSALAHRCNELRGFAPVRVVEPLDRSRDGNDAEPHLLAAVNEGEAPRQVVLDGASLGYKAVFDLAAAAHARGCEVYLTGRLASPLDVTRVLFRLFEVPVARVGRPSAPARRSVLSRAFDVTAAGLALLLLAPLFALVALLIRWDSPGPVFFRQERVGLNGRRFQMLKFRSMRVDNEPARHREAVTAFIAEGSRVPDELARRDEWGRPVYKLTDDDRVTRVGRWLRAWSLDELPQLWNVLRGDMSLVGPRPALPYDVEAYRPWHHGRLQVTPGVTGLWQVAGRSRVSFDEMVFQDMVYGCNQGLLTDLGLCLRTVGVVLARRGAA